MIWKIYYPRFTEAYYISLFCLPAAPGTDSESSTISPTSLVLPSFLYLPRTRRDIALLHSYYYLSRHTVQVLGKRGTSPQQALNHHYGPNRSRPWHATITKSGVRWLAKTGSVIGMLKRTHICTSVLPTFTVTPGCLWVWSKNHNLVKLIDSKPI